MILPLAPKLPYSNSLLKFILPVQENNLTLRVIHAVMGVLLSKLPFELKDIKQDGKRREGQDGFPVDVGCSTSLPLISDDITSVAISESFNSNLPIATASAAGSIFYQPQTANELETAQYHTSLQELGDDLQKAANAVFPNKILSKYSQTSVLLLLWDNGDPRLPLWQKPT